MNFEGYELLWPAQLFVEEVGRINEIHHDRGSEWGDKMEFLLVEAFRGNLVVSEFQRHPLRPKPEPWGSEDWPRATPTGPVGVFRDTWLDLLIANISTVRDCYELKPYWPQRVGLNSSSWDRVERAPAIFARMVAEFNSNGYFEEIFGRDCVDSINPMPPPSVELEDRLGFAVRWPLQWEEWGNGTFFGLMEIFHDLISRPRVRELHRWDNCGWHYSDFDFRPARKLYRWKVNRLLERCEIDYRLAEEGEDVGRLVAVTDDSRSDLIHRVLISPTPQQAGQVSHAIALFRGRGATNEAKRSAIVTLAHILEERRQLIRSELGRKDEGDLFMIANGFNVRHQREMEKRDYDPAFLDWFFWWYLATIEVTDKIISRQDHDSTGN